MSEQPKPVLEPAAYPIADYRNAPDQLAVTSIAISLKRIADVLEKLLVMAEAESNEPSHGL